jgi:Zn-dependent protease with chaperone function
MVLMCPPTGAQDLPRGNASHALPSINQPGMTAYTLPPDKLEKSKALYTLSVGLRIVDSIYSFLVLLALLLFGIAARFRDWAESVSRWRFVQALVFVPLLMITISLLGLPLRAYGHHVSLAYGLSIEGWGPWFADFVKGEALTALLAVAVLWTLTTIIRKSPKRWWFHAWLAALPILVFVVFVYPLVIDPMFNNFEPLEKNQPQLADAIEKVVQRGGLNIPRSRIYEMDASRRYTTLNAYVTGFGASKRVVVWDTTIQKMATPETLFIFGHEMGHYVLHHIIYGMIAGAVGLLLGLYLVYRLSGWTLKIFQQRARIPELSDWAAVPVILMLFGVLGFFAEPVGNTFSRHIEHQADIYGLEVTHGINPNSRETAAHAFQVLGEQSLDYPYPSKWVVLWYYDHPDTSERVRFAREYDP